MLLIKHVLNPKHEIRNSKQFLIAKILNIKASFFGPFEHSDFGFVSSFDIRISNFWNSQNLFGSGYDGLSLPNQRTRHK
jgi:hypothetical protein